MRPLLIAGIALMAAGAIGVAVIQSGTATPSVVSATLEPGRHVEARVALEAPDTAFVSTTLGSLGAEARIVVLSPAGEELYDGITSTKKSVDYFMVDRPGEHTLRATLLSAAPSSILVELGQTSSAASLYPSIVLIAGVIGVVVWSCIAIVRYITAQPDENTL